jgi:pilus assembly protein TadC
MEPADHPAGADRRGRRVTGHLLLAGALFATAATIAVERWSRRSRRRLTRVLPAASLARPARRRRTWPGGLDRARLGAGLGAFAVLVLIGGWWGLLAAAVAAVGLDRGLRRLEPAMGRAQRVEEVAGLPLAADLLAVALRAGTPVGQAVAAVGDTLPGRLGDRLARTARLLNLGATATQAWAELAPVPGADRLIRAAVRSAEHGSALAASLRGLADDLRADRAATAEAAARRAGVLIVLPLGLCFLPAFILAGLVPVIVAVLGDVL